MDVDEIQDAIEPVTEDQVADRQSESREHDQSTIDQSNEHQNLASTSNFYGWSSNAFKRKPNAAERSSSPLTIPENDMDHASSVADEEETKEAK